MVATIKNMILRWVIGANNDFENMPASSLRIVVKLRGDEMQRKDNQIRKLQSIIKQMEKGT